MRFHHIGYAVRSITAYLEDFFTPLYAPLAVSKISEDPIQRVRVCFATLPGNVVVELVEPMGDDSPVNGIIGSQRGGLYHQCFEVDDLEVEILRFRKKSCMPLGEPVAAAAFGGRRIVFLLTPQRDLIELLEAGP